MDEAALVAVATALSTVAGLLYRELVKRAERAEQERDEWRDRYFGLTGVADFAIDQAERKAKKR